MPGFAWWPFQELFLSLHPAEHPSSTLPQQTLLTACLGFGHCTQQLLSTFIEKEHPAPKFWELQSNNLHHHAVMCDMGKVQGVFTLSNHEDYSWCSLLPTAPHVVVLYPRLAQSFCHCLLAHQLKPCLDTGREKYFAVKAV